MRKCPTCDTPVGVTWECPRCIAEAIPRRKVREDPDDPVHNNGGEQKRGSPPPRFFWYIPEKLK